MNTTRKQDSSLSAAAKRCLELLLTAELDGHPVEFHTWRAQNAKKIPLLDELKRHRAIEGDTHCAVTFWGLMSAPGKRAALALTNCERVFKALRKHYPRHPKDPLKLSELARQTKLDGNDALQSARFLSRSPVYLSISTHEGDPNLVPNEQYVTLKGFEDVKEMARDENRRARTSVFPALLAEQGLETRLTWNLSTSESKEVRDSWHKALERIFRDPEGAITAGRSLLEAACKHVIEEFGESSDKYLDLPALYKRATALLKFDPRPDVGEPLRRSVLRLRNRSKRYSRATQSTGGCAREGSTRSKAGKEARGIHRTDRRGHVRTAPSHIGCTANAMTPSVLRQRSLSE